MSVFFIEKTTETQLPKMPKMPANLEVAEECENLLSQIDNLVMAIKDNKAIQSLADNFGENTWWSSAKNIVSGKNDKDLAIMIQRLGGSLETTQTVVQLMLRLQTRKDHVLREFHSVLVDKVIKIQGDTTTLDKNQQEVALAIVSALKDQVEDHLVQSKTVEEHKQQLKEITAALKQHVDSQKAFTEDLNLLSSHIKDEVTSLRSGLMQLSDELQTTVVEADKRMQRQDMALEALEVKQIEGLSQLGESLNTLQATCEGDQKQFHSAVEVISIKLDQMVVNGDALAQRVSRIETTLAAMFTWRGRLLSHSVGLVGLFIALSTVAYLLKS